MTSILFAGRFAGRPLHSDNTVTGLEVFMGASDWLVVSETGRGAHLMESRIALSGASLSVMTTHTIGDSGDRLLDMDSHAHAALITADTASDVLQLRAETGSVLAPLTGSADLGVTRALMIDDTYMLVARRSLDGPAILSRNGDTLSPVGALSVEAFGYRPVSDLALVQIGSQKIGIAASAEASAIASFIIAADGRLTLSDTLGVATGLGIDAPVDLVSSTVAGRHFVIAASQGTSSLSVLEVGASGAMTVRDQINDNRLTRFADTLQVETITVNGCQIVATAGSDGGLTVFRLLETGILVHLATYNGNDGTDPITHLELATDAGHLHLFAASERAGDVRHFTLDLGDQDRTLFSTGSNMSGGSGDDILVAESGRMNITGGAGADIFVIGAEAERVSIQDYNRFEDQIDLSLLPRLYSLDALGFTPLSDGIHISTATLHLTLRSHDGASLDRSDFLTDDLLRLWRLPPAEQQGDNTQTSGSGALPRLEGSGSTDSLLGGGGSDFLRGLSGDDLLHGGGGNDLISGDTGRDLLTGGTGSDTFLFRAGGEMGDVVADYEVAHFDLAEGRIVGDLLLFEATVLPSVRLSGTDLLVGDVRVTGAASDNLMFAYTTLNTSVTNWRGPLQDGYSPFGTNLTVILQDHGDNDVFRVQTGLYNVSGHLNRIVIDNDDNSRIDHRYDPENTEAWSQRILTYSTGRDLLGRTDLLDDGSRLEIHYDPLGNRSWQTLSRLQDSSGQEADFSVLYDNGLNMRRLTDTLNTASWMQVVEYRDANGRLFDKRTTYDDGQTQRVLSDTFSRYSWSTLLETRDTNNQVVEKTFNYDIGLSQRSVFDISGTETWQRVLEKRDATGALAEKLTFFDGGHQQRFVFDAGNSGSWARIEELRSNTGRITEKTVLFDTGETHENRFDTDNSQSWTRLLRIRDEAGQLTEEIHHQDSGIRLREVFDVAETRSWSRLEEARTTEGRLYEQTFVFDSGTSTRTQFDVSNRNWRSIVEERDEANRLTETRTTYDDMLQIRSLLDPGDTRDWSQIDEYRNRAGDLYDKRTLYDSGTQTRLLLDTDDAASWDMIQEIRDMSGELSQKNLFFDDGRSQVTLFDVAGTESWDSYTRLFADDGTLLSEGFG